MKTFEQFNEMDPFGEEDWEEESPFQVGDRVICTAVNTLPEIQFVFPDFIFPWNVSELHNKKGTVEEVKPYLNSIIYVIKFDEIRSRYFMNKTYLKKIEE